MSGPSRTPYAKVVRELRREVGFQCPVKDCGNPYLTWHHFDPPWRDEHHHRPEGMIALCAEHANKADNGAFTDDQLRELKQKEPQLDLVRGRFDWRRQDFLVRLGGNFFYNLETIFQIGNVPCVWLSRDEDNLLEVNFRMPSIAGETRASITKNFWSAPRSADQIISPPMGRLIDVRYKNGDQFKIHFKNIKRPEYLSALYESSGIDPFEDIPFPTTLVEITSRAAGTGLDFGPNESRIGSSTIRNCMMMNIGGAGIMVDASAGEIATLFPCGEAS